MRHIIADTNENRVLMQSIHTLIQNDPALFQNLGIEGADAVRVQEEVYQLGAGIEAAQIVYDDQGSSLFAALRQGQRNETDEMRWEQQVNNVANIYRDKYSVIAYDLGTEISQEKRELYAQLAEVFAESLNGVLGYRGDDALRYIRAGATHTGASTYYCIKMRINVKVKTSARGGTSGKAHPIICRLYFRKDSDGLVLLTKEEAWHIDNSMKNQTRPSALPATSAAGIKQDISYLLTGGIEDDKFTRSALLSEESLLWLNGLSNNVVLQCVDMNLLSYAFIKDSDFRTEICDKRGHAALELCFRMDSLSVYCRNCINQDGVLSPLVLNNTMVRSATFGVGGEAGDAQIRLDMTALLAAYRLNHAEAIATARRVMDAALGQAKSEVDSARNPKYEVFYHLHKLAPYRECQLVCTARRHVCSCQLDAGVPACEDCPRPEIMYLDPLSGVKYKTKTRRYVFDGLCMQAAEDTLAECRCCHRHFVQDNGSGMCPTCHNALEILDPTRRKAAAKLYRQYRNVLPMTVRLAATLGLRKKYAYEDNGLVLFVLEYRRRTKTGEQVKRRLFKFDKLAIADAGYLANAQELHLS